MATWGIAKAKSRLSELIYEAEKTGPQKVSRSGREIAVVLSLDEWKRLQSRSGELAQPKNSLADFLMASPLRGSGIKIPRVKLRLRKLDL